MSRGFVMAPGAYGQSALLDETPRAIGKYIMPHAVNLPRRRVDGPRAPGGLVDVECRDAKARGDLAAEGEISVMLEGGGRSPDDHSVSRRFVPFRLMRLLMSHRPAPCLFEVVPRRHRVRGSLGLPAGTGRGGTSGDGHRSARGLAGRGARQVQ
jgi:hypothetical protein